MKIMKPEPFTFEAGPRAVLLLHGFTGHSADVRMLGRYLEKKGYTSHAPIYRGHGVEPEKLLGTGPKDWKEDVEEAYEYLLFLGYEEIAIAGLSLGGVLGLDLAASKRIKGIVPMCTPMFFDNKTQLTKGFQSFARQYKQFQQLDEETIKQQVDNLMEQSKPLFQRLAPFIDEVSQKIDQIYAPAFIVQAVKDEMINPESADYIYNHIGSEEKNIKWYKESSHVITMDKEKDQLHEDIFAFLENLNWEQ